MGLVLLAFVTFPKVLYNRFCALECVLNRRTLWPQNLSDVTVRNQIDLPHHLQDGHVSLDLKLLTTRHTAVVCLVHHTRNGFFLWSKMHWIISDSDEWDLHHLSIGVFTLFGVLVSLLCGVSPPLYCLFGLLLYFSIAFDEASHLNDISDLCGTLLEFLFDDGVSLSTLLF